MSEEHFEPPDEAAPSIIHFEDKAVRRHWDAEQEKQFISVIDVLGALTGSTTPKRYWTDLKKKLKGEGFQLYDFIVQLKFLAKDGKKYATDCTDVETMFRIIQAVPSPKAEPIKQWLARVGYERIEEIKDPEKAIHRAVDTYAAKGRDEEWIGRRLRSIEVRNEVTREWKKRGIGDKADFATLTNDVYRAWSGMSSREYKAHKGLKDQNLRDHMTPLELVLNMLGETATAEIARQADAQGLEQNRVAAMKGGGIAGTARKNIEDTTGKSVLSATNYLTKPSDRKRLN